MSDGFFEGSEEVFNLYSSKEVMDTFNTHLKKIAANNHLICAISNANNGSTDCRKKKKNQISERQVNTEKEEAISVAHKSNEIDILIVDEFLAKPVGANYKITDSDSSENSIEVIAVTSRKRNRQSERLKYKSKNAPNPAQNQLYNVTLNTPVHGKVTQSRTKALKGKKEHKKPVEVTLEVSPQQAENDDELNPEISVKVIWKSVSVKKFMVRKFQKLSYVFKQLSKEENVPEDKIILTFNNVRVSHNDTPDSLNLQVYHFLDGGVLSELSNLCETPNSLNYGYDGNSITIKFQDAYKKIIRVKLNKSEKLKLGMLKCSEQLDIPLGKIRFLFDGEFLNPSETPASLGLEGEEIIDIKISS